MPKETIIVLECFKGQSYPGGKVYQGCGHKWVERLALPMIVEAFTARVAGASHCPKCGTSKNTMMLTGECFRDAYKELLGVEPPVERLNAHA